MYTTLPITTVLRNPQKIHQQIKRGKRFTVFSRSKPIFNIVPLEEENTFHKPLKKPVSLNIGLPLIITSDDLYTKYAK